MDAGEGGVVDRPVHFQFESLSLADVRDPFETQSRQCALPGGERDVKITPEPPEESRGRTVTASRTGSRPQ